MANPTKKDLLDRAWKRFQMRMQTIRKKATMLLARVEEDEASAIRKRISQKIEKH